MDSLDNVLRALPRCFVLDKTIALQDYVAIDLSKTNKALLNVDVSSSQKLGDFINSHIARHHAKVAYGGYIETRGIYQRSDYFNNTNPETERNIHIGLDLWIAADTPIYAPLEARLHSFNNNLNYGDYGPTIILEHEHNGITFYTLYGHLSLESLEGLTVGQRFEQGDQIATLGDSSVNGDYAPHLHFQIIKDIGTYKGDYPGVTSMLDIDFYRSNCPDPNLLLKLNL